MSCLNKLVWALLMVLGGCALPPDPGPEQSFIPSPELRTVALVREGLYFFGRSRYFDAEVRLRQALTIRPEAENIRFNLAVVLTQSGQYAEAEAILSDLLARRPDDVKLLAAAGRLYSAQGRFETARRFYDQALAYMIELEDWPRAARLARSLAVLSFRFGDEAAALCYSAQALDLLPDQAEQARHARLLTAAGYFAKTQRIFGGVLDSSATAVNAELLHVLALAAYGWGSKEEAVKLEDRALDKLKSSPGIEAEALLARFAALDFKAEAEDGEAAEEETVDPVQSYYESGGPGTAARLYWPVNLYEAVTAYAAAKGFDAE